MRRLISPFQMITDHCSPPSLDTHTHTHTCMHTNNLSDLATRYTTSLCVDTWRKKGKHLISALSLLLSSDTYISSACGQNTITEARERGPGFICPGEWDALTSTMTICDNSVSRRQYSAISIRLRCRDARTVGARDEWDIAARLRDISHFQNKQYRRLKWISPAEGTQATRAQLAGRRKQTICTRGKKKKTPVGIPHTLGVTGSVFWVHFAQDNGSFGRSFSVYSCQPVSHSVSHCRKHFQSYRLKLMCIKVWVLHNHTSWAWTGFCYLLGTDHVRTGSPWGPKWGPHHVWGPGWVQGHAMNQRWVKLKVWVRLSSYRSFVVSFVHHFMQFTLKSV